MGIEYLPNSETIMVGMNSLESVVLLSLLQGSGDLISKTTLPRFPEYSQAADSCKWESK